MKVQLESTDKVIQFEVGGASVPARIWIGETENGVRCHAYITRIAVDKSDDGTEFERDMLEQHAPAPAELQAIPLRMIL